MQHNTRTFDSIHAMLRGLSTIFIEQCEEKGLCIRVNNQHGQVLISLFGGHVLSYVNKVDNKERLWLSKAAVFDQKTPIRGGIPICWPWFSSHRADATFPSHGYARTQMFKLIDAHELTENEQVTLTTITLVPTKVCQFGYENIDMKLVISLDTQLRIDITTTNNGNAPVALTQALHSYFLVEDIREIQLLGIDSPYDDKLTHSSNNLAPTPYLFTQEVDRIHFVDVPQHINGQQISIANSVKATGNLQKTIHSITHTGHDSTVVWNPWIDKSRGMTDMENDGYLRMLCIEAANTINAHTPLYLAKGSSHTLSQTMA